MRDEKLDELLGDECRCNQHGDCFDCTLRAHIEQHYVPIADYDDQRENLFAVKLILVEALGLEGDPNDIRLGDVVDAVRARVPIAKVRGLKPGESYTDPVTGLVVTKCSEEPTNEALGELLTELAIEVAVASRGLDHQQMCASCKVIMPTGDRPADVGKRRKHILDAFAELEQRPTWDEVREALRKIHGICYRKANAILAEMQKRRGQDDEPYTAQWHESNDEQNARERDETDDET